MQPVQFIDNKALLCNFGEFSLVITFLKIDWKKSIQYSELLKFQSNILMSMQYSGLVKKIQANYRSYAKFFDISSSETGANQN